MSHNEVPADYQDRVYAGVLGKIIGVYLGRPFEGWLHDEILAKLGPIEYYVHDRLSKPLVVSDDDISGTFTFLRALSDYGTDQPLTAEQIGQTWLNYIIEDRTILWWGGLGVSTEHTAFLRLKNGLKAPHSGSIQTNGRLVAEQIGSQIFIDGWGLVNPGDPERAAAMAALAASVSHDGEAIYGAQIIAAMVAQAFVDSNLQNLLETALRFIPSDSLISRLIKDLREWHGQGLSWQEGFHRIQETYSYDQYGGGCHIIPNHAIVIHALLHGNSNFQRSLMIANTLGWDTDCNSGNVGCVLGVVLGLKGINEGPDWRGPVADRMIIPTADSGGCITDATTEGIKVANLGRRLRGLSPIQPKNGARFHFELPGGVQGFHLAGQHESNVELGQTSEAGQGVLQIAFKNLQPSEIIRAVTDTFPSAEVCAAEGYSIVASPTIYPGQTVRANLSADRTNPHPIEVKLVAIANEKATYYSTPKVIAPGSQAQLSWRIPPLGADWCEKIGIEFTAAEPQTGKLNLESLTWDGCPDLQFVHSERVSWHEQWVSGVSAVYRSNTGCRLVQNERTGLLITGTREWQNYSFEANIIPHLCAATGIAVRVQGMKRYYALVLQRGKGLQLVKALDGESVLARCELKWELGETYKLHLSVHANTLVGSINGVEHLRFEDQDNPLEAGGVAFVLTEGRIDTDQVRVCPNPQ